MFMSIHPRAADSLGIVQVNCHQLIKANQAIEFAEGFPSRGLAANVVSRSKNVCGIEADT